MNAPIDTIGKAAHRESSIDKKMPSKTIDFLAALYGADHEDIPIFFRSFNEQTKKPVFSTWTTYKLAHDKLISLQQGGKRGIFYCPNITDINRIKDTDIIASYSVFIDIDDAPLPTSFAISPSCIVDGGDGKHFHVYWFIEKTRDLESWKDVQKALINYYGSDSAIKNPARLMRLPDSINFKDPNNPR